jgi:hypothetical protein
MEFQRDPRKERLIANIKILKAELKVLAVEIRQLKSTRKQCKNGYVSGLGNKQNEFRIKHIARCLLRGRTLEQIEPKLKDPMDPNHTYVRTMAAAVVKKVMEVADGEALRASS